MIHDVRRGGKISVEIITSSTTTELPLSLPSPFLCIGVALEAQIKRCALTMAAKELLIAHCSSASAAASIAAILQSSIDIKIAVPCAVLSPQAKHSASNRAASKVVVAVKSCTPAGELHLDCGSFWKGGECRLAGWCAEWAVLQLRAPAS